MANPRIVWNANNLDFPQPLSRFDYRRKASRVLSRSDGIVHATSVRGTFDEVRFVLGQFSDGDFEAALRAWWAWAALGKAYSFTLDPAILQQKTLAANAAVGATVLTLSGVGGLNVGQSYLLREVIGNEEEIVEILSISSPTVTLTAGIKYDYLTGAVFRTLDHFPKVISLDDDYPVTQEVTTWTMDHHFREDKG